MFNIEKIVENHAQEFAAICLQSGLGLGFGHFVVQILELGYCGYKLEAEEVVLEVLGLDVVVELFGPIVVF